jgi:uncharacterized repeat protein (TIGR01451 family)
MIFRSLAALSVLLVSSSAYAAADLSLSMSPPPAKYVYESGTYNLVVSNIGNKTANNVSMTIQLPETNTSPQVYVMGTLGTFDARCTRSGSVLTCALGSMGRNTSKTVFFNIALPYSTEPIVIDGTVSTSSNENTLANNGVSHTASLLTYDVVMAPPEYAVNSHCTGIGLSSYFECTLFPSSISSHDTIFEAGGTISFVGAPPNYTGTWSQPAADELIFDYFEDGQLAATFEGRGVSSSCFEGMTTFPGSPYMSMYHVCLQ